jgi:hypothetical protein
VIDPSPKPLPESTQHSPETYMPPVGFETAIPASETHVLDCAATQNCNNNNNDDEDNNNNVIS